MKRSVILLLIFIMAACSPAGSLARTAQPAVPTQLPETLPVLQLSPTPIAAENLRLYVHPAVPQELIEAAGQPKGWTYTGSPDEADVILEPVKGNLQSARWVYALAAPFATLEDGIRLADLQAAWKGSPLREAGGKPLLVDAQTRAVLVFLWGEPAAGAVQVLAQDDLLDSAWEQRPCLAVVPFEHLEPRWKVLRVDGKSPLDQNFQADSYPLAVSFAWTGKQDALSALQASGSPNLPAGNRLPEKFTSLVMTGTTALVRSIAARMEQKGMTYPAGDIGAWLKQADILHISNEIAFDPTCPQADFFSHSLRFCSRPEYYELLEYVGMDVVELSGNHVLDWSPKSFEFTLQWYRDHNMPYFAGGENTADAQKAAYLEHHGNRFAFIGCNKGGPPHAWATESSAGAAPCDYLYMKSEIQRLLKEGYIPIVTFQYNETYGFPPVPQQKIDFNDMASNGAVLVSGSQSHFPMSMAFVDGKFIHYGLGNLFFDQMDLPVVGTRREFIDRHIFYDGRHVSTELLTAMLEDYSRPRPMTAEERSALLSEAFKASGWKVTPLPTATPVQTPEKRKEEHR